MKPGRPKWTLKVSRPVVERIQAALAGGEKPRAVFDRFNIQQYGITPRTFREWSDIYLREWEARQPEGEEPSAAASARTLLDSLLSRLQASVDAGRLPDERIGDAIHAAARAIDSDFRRNADARAQKLFDAKVEKLKPAVTQAVASGSADADANSVRSILGRVSSGAMTVDDAIVAIDGVLWIEIDKHMRGAA